MEHVLSSSSGGGMSPEIKELYRALYIVVKQLDDERKQVSTVKQLFVDLEEKRSQLVQLCKQIMFKDYQNFGKKAREIMWRKGYHEFIAYEKKHWNTQLRVDTEYKRLERFLCAGFSNYKRIAVKMEELYDLDLKYLIDFTIISEGIGSAGTRMLDGQLCNGDDGDDDTAPGGTTPHAVDKSLEAVSFALDTIHSSLLSLGDLHRYFLDFKIKSELKISKEQAAKYYFEAFKLNPAIGMAQNQLGTLYYGQNHDLDSIYYYLYSLVSIIPFEPSENNVCKLFATHSEYLENLVCSETDFNLKIFYARFYLIVDIFFFDKEVPDFNSLCHCVLLDLRKILGSNKMPNAEVFTLDESSIFKIVSILFFCLSKLKMINSQKVYSLNAFLVAVCSDLMDDCIANFDRMTVANNCDNEFSTMYMKRFNEFDATVRKSRNEYKNWLAVHGGEAERKDVKVVKTSVANVKDVSSDSRENDVYIIKMHESIGKLASEQMTADKNNIDPMSTRSSDEAKESDLKTPLSCKSKRRGMKLRRRRRKIAQSDDSSCYDTESDMDTDFSTDEGDYTDLSSNFDTDFSDIEPERADRDERDVEEPQHGGELFGRQLLPSTANRPAVPLSVSAPAPTFSDNDDDVVIEEENIISPEEYEQKQQQQQLQQQQQHQQQQQSFAQLRDKSQENDSDELLHSFELLSLASSGKALNFKCSDQEEHEASDVPGDVNAVPKEPPKKLLYRNRYTKFDPNLTVEFAKREPTMRALKILFDWLRINQELLYGCYHSNPEFIHKIMKLLNNINIDIFTRKVFFEREFLHTANVRTALSDLFDVRTNVPLSEDFVFKSFDIFQATQIPLDWETTIRERVTEEEECILRIFKMVDFGFFICKQTKFNYRFCGKTRRFIENTKKKREEKKSASRRRELRTAKNAARKRAEGRTRRYSDRKNGIVRKSYTSNEEKDTVEECKKLPRKGYLRNRNADKLSASGGGGDANDGGGGGGGGEGGATSASTTTTTTTNSAAAGEKLFIQSSSGADEERSEAMTKKCEIMGKLWLKNEVATLEEELRKDPLQMTLTPFIVVDAKALTEYNGIVKNLVKSKKFIVIIPNAVLNELDDLKKRSENARNVIRWLEQEFKHGNRHVRAQRDNENLTLSLLKIPRKLDREAAIFLKIAQLCNHLVANHSDPNATEFKKNVVTYLSGDLLYEKQRGQVNLSFSGILDAISVRYAQIATFYARFKASKK